MTILDLNCDEIGIITALEQSDWMLKLVEMGCYPGKSITLVRKSLFQDPICVKVSGYQLLLRRDEAHSIKIEKCGDPLKK